MVLLVVMVLVMVMVVETVVVMAAVTLFLFGDVLSIYHGEELECFKVSFGRLYREPASFHKALSIETTAY